MQPIKLKKGSYLAFLLTGGSVTNSSPRLTYVQDVEDYVVIPSAPASPIQVYLENDKTLTDPFGIMLIQHAASLPALHHAANHAFFDLPLAKLKQLSEEFHLDLPCITLPDTVTSLVAFFIEKYTGTPPDATELQAIISLRYHEESLLVKEVVDEDALLEVIDPDDHKVMQASQILSFMIYCLMFCFLIILN